MARPAGNAIHVSSDAYIWITKVIANKAKVATTTTDKKLAKWATAINTLNAKLGEAPVYDQARKQTVLSTTRVELRLIQGIAKNERAALVDKIIPEYERRSLEATEATQRGKLLDYVAAATARVAIIDTLLNTIERRLHGRDS